MPPTFKKAGDDDLKGSVYIGYPAKLIVNDRVIADQFPESKKGFKGSREWNVTTEIYVSDSDDENVTIDDVTVSVRCPNNQTLVLSN